MGNFFSASKQFMNMFKYRAKFLLIFSTIVLLVGGVIYLLLSNLYAQVDFNSKENLGVKYINPLRSLLISFHDSRYDAFVGQNISKYQDETKSNIDKLNKIDAELNQTLKVEDAYEKIKTNWKDIKPNYDTHTQVINDTIALISHVNDTSNLVLDPDLDTYYLMDSYSLKIPALLNNINLLKIELVKNLKQGKDNKTELIKLATLSDELNGLLAGDFTVMYGFNPSLKDTLNDKFVKYDESHKKLLSELNSVIDGKKVPLNLIINTADAAYNNTTVLYDAYADAEYKLIDKRVHKYADQVPVAITFTILVLLLIGYIFGGFYSSVADAISTISAESEKISRGDLNTEVKLDTKDEMVNLSGSINNIVTSLNKLVKNVVNTAEEIAAGSEELNASAEHVASGAEQLSTSISQLASGAQEQAANLSVSLDNINKMNKIIQNIVQHVEETVVISGQTEDNALSARQESEKAVEKINKIKAIANEVSVSINELGQLGSEIGQILDLIKSIANQTNLLALNASIEAARAGEHGKGFTVVAEEVKKLAGQSAESSDKISEMIKKIIHKTDLAVDAIGNVVNEVDSGVTLVGSTGNSLKEILSAAKNTSTHVTEVSTELNKLKQNAGDVVKMVENVTAITTESSSATEEISHITETQAASFQQISASSASLAKIAESLLDSISVFKCRR